MRAFGHVWALLERVRLFLIGVRRFGVYKFRQGLWVWSVCKVQVQGLEFRSICLSDEAIEYFSCALVLWGP